MHSPSKQERKGLPGPIQPRSGEEEEGLFQRYQQIRQEEEPAIESPPLFLPSFLCSTFANWMVQSHERHFLFLFKNCLHSSC